MMNMKEKQSNTNLSARTQSIALNGTLAALAIALSALESSLPPIPMLPPGAKLGLSNLATMYAAGACGLFPALCIAVIKSFFSGITGGVTALLMSLCGGVASTFVMWLLLKAKNPFGTTGLGVAGALTHNAAQLAVAAVLTTPAVVYYIPWLILFGVLSGILTGTVLHLILPLLNRIP